jgi:surfeit locus 1 family protein
MRIRFSPRLVPTLAAFAMIALTVFLGRWQADRAEEKEGRQKLLEARLRETPLTLAGSGGSAEALLYRRVRAAGEWVAEGQIFIDNQLHQGRAGFHVVTPLRIRGEKAAVLVNRGWTPRTREYPAPPAIPVPEGPALVEGLATLPPARVLELSTETVAGSVWQNLSLARYAERMRMEVLPIVVLAEPPAPGLVAVTERPDAGVMKHREYSLTWFSLAATVAALWLFFSWRTEPR